MSEIDPTQIQWDDEEQGNVVDPKLIQWDDPVGDRLDSMHKAASLKPDEAARYDQLAQKAGVPFEVAKAVPDKVEQKINTPNWRDFSSTAPRTAKHLSENPVAFQQARDDIDSLAQLEQAKGTRWLDAAKGGLLPAGEQIRKSLVEGLGIIKAERANAEREQRISALSNQFTDQARAEAERIAGLPLQDRQAAWERLGGEGVVPAAAEGMLPGLKRGLAAQYDDSIRKGEGQWAGSESAQEQAQLDREMSVITDMSQESRDKIKSMKIETKPWSAEWFVQEGLSAITQAGTGAAIGVATGGTGVLPYFYGSAAGDVYFDPARAGMSEQDKLATSRVAGLAEGIGESIGSSAIISNLADAAAPFIKRLVSAAGANFAEEQLTEIVNQTYTAAANGEIDGFQLDPNSSLPENIQKTLHFIDQQWQAGVLGMIGGGAPIVAQQGGKTVIDRMALRQDKRAEKEAQAKAGADNLQQQIGLVEQSMTAGRNITTMHQLLDAMDGDEVQEVYIDPKQLLNQQGMTAEALQEVAPSIGPQLQEAMDKGALVRLPVNELLVGLRGKPELQAAIVQHVKRDPGSDSLYEANQASAELATEMAAEADRFIAARQNASELVSLRDRLMDLDRQRLANSGLDPQGIEKVAALDASMAIATGVRAGVAPEQVFSEFFGRVSRQLAGGDVLGGVLNQGSGVDPVLEQWRAAGIDGQVFENGDVITLSKIVVPEGSRGAGAGTQAMQQLIDYADANGKHVVLSPSADFGGNVKRLKNFYKRFGFVENKGKNRAFSTRESMYRQADGKLLFQGGDPTGDNNSIDTQADTGVVSKSEVNDYANSSFYASIRAGQEELSSRIIRSGLFEKADNADGRGSGGIVPQQWAQPSAYSDVRRGEGSFLKEESSPETIRAESDRLIAAAKENGFFWDDSNPIFDQLADAARPTEAGAEHDAYFVGSGENRVVIRSTANGTYGPTKDTSPAQYLQRLEENNIVFPDMQIHMIAVSQDEDGNAVIWTAQKFVEGKEFGTEAELEAAMNSYGWEREGVSYRYRHRDTGAVIQDAHTGNVLYNGADLYPIDVIVEKLPKQQLFQDQAAPRGAFSPDTREIMLLPRADLSTFLHESGHLFLEITADLAAREGASDGLKADMDAAFKWFGIKGDTFEQRMEAWNKMTLDQKRPHHEKWAESFEQYLFEGNAPSVELREAFRNFRAWLTHVYKSISNFLAGHPDAKLNDEVRGIFDRMLATEEQIREAEAARGMAPLFTAKPENMTEAEWQEYQDAARVATDSAIEQLTSRSLRDMKWLSNAKTRTLRKMQREVAAERREARMEARTQVLGQPIYRAWQFLRSPLMGAKAANQKAKASDSVDPARDSLLAAIAKLGGLNRDQAVSQYGIDPADFHRKSGVFGKPVLRAKGGLSPDAMAEALSQFGYMPLNEHGQWDIQDMDDMLREEAAGNAQYSNQADYDLLLGMTADPRMATPDAESVDYVGGRLNRGDLIEMYGYSDPDVQWADPVPVGWLNQPAKSAGNPNFERWSRGAPVVTAEASRDKMFRSGEPVVLEAFHGTQRPDRVGVKFLKKRATSGPMAFFTNAPELASGYAEGKQDTSLADEDTDYKHWFKVDPPKGSRTKIDIERAWYFLDSETKKTISERMKDIRLDDDAETVIYEEGGGDLGNYEWELKQARGNVLKAAAESWLMSGAIFGEEQKFMDVLRLAGFPVKTVEYDPPHAAYPFLYHVAIRMGNPLVTSDIPQDVIDALHNAAKKDRSRSGSRKADAWDKTSRTLREWVAAFDEDMESGANSYVWTSIPDKVTDVFRSLGYDGIIDYSGKGGGDNHKVYIPFEENNVKSYIGNKGTYDESNNILKQNGDESAAQSRSLESMGMVSDDGLHPDTVAELFGLSSGDELVRKLLTLPDPAAEIERLTDEIMLQRHAELATPDGMERAAEAAIHNEARARFLATELAMLNRAIGKPRMIMTAARDYAERIVTATRVRDLRPGQYDAAEAKAGREADKAMREGRTSDAALAKRNQVLHNMTARMVREAQDEVALAVKYLKKFDKPNKRIDPEYQEQIDTLLERYDLRQRSLKAIDRSQNLLQWVQQQQAAGLEPMIPDYLLDEAQRVSYKMLTMEELRGLVDAVKNIEHLGRLKNRLLTDREKRRLNAIANAVADSVLSNGGDPKEPKLEQNALADRARKLAKGFASMHRKLASIVRQLDGWKDGGILWDVLVKPMNDAGTDEAIRHEKATIALADVFAPLKGKKLTAKTYIPAIADSLSYEGRLAIALNWGNEGNRQRLLDGRGWGPQEVQAILYTLTESDWQFVQGVWDHLDTYREEIGAQQKRLTGVEPDWVQPTPFEIRTADGKTITVKGGYYPAKYDTDASVKALSNEAAGNLMDQWKAAKGRGKTRDGFTKARVQQVKGRPLRADLGVITQHVSEVIHRLSYQDWIVDANRLLAMPQVEQAIVGYAGDTSIISEMRKAIEDIAAGEIPAQNAFEKAINHLRVGTTVAGLGWNLTTSLLQPMGLTQSMVRIGPKWVAKGLASWLGDPTRMNQKVEWVYSKSDFMRLRGKTMMREMNEVLNSVRREKLSKLESTYFYAIQKMQMAADMPTWLGAYERALHEGYSEDIAVSMADQAVLDAQGGGQVKDLSRIQRGSPLMKLWTNFYSFFNTTYNLSREVAGRTKWSDPVSVGHAAVDYLLLYSLPAAMGSILKGVVLGDDDDDELASRLVRDQISYLFGSMVGLREIAAATSGFQGYSGPAGTRFFSEFAKLGKQIEQGDADEAFWKALNNSAGILLHYPAGQINRTVQGYQALASGETSNPAALLFGPMSQ